MAEHNCMRDFLCDSLWMWYKSDDEDEDDNSIALNKALLQASNQYEAEESQLQALNNTAAASSKASGSTLKVPSNAVSSSSLSSTPRQFLDKGLSFRSMLRRSTLRLLHSQQVGGVNGLTPINPIRVVNPPCQFR